MSDASQARQRRGCWFHPDRSDSRLRFTVRSCRPRNLTGIDSDVPVLSWEPADGAVAYRVVIALDRDFTNRVAGIPHARCGFRTSRDL